MTTLQPCSGNEEAPLPPPAPPHTFYDCMLVTSGTSPPMTISQVPSMPWQTTLRASSHELLSHFNSVYPQPVPWTGCDLSPEMSSRVIIALCKQRSDPASFSAVQQKPPIRGTCGWLSAPNTKSIPGSQTKKTRFHTSKSLASVIAMEDLHPARSPFDLAQWLTHCAWSDRHTSYWGPETTASTTTQGK